MRDNHNYQDEYHDRKMLKWTGFILSEHATATAKKAKELKEVYPAKEEMSEEELNAVFNEARISNKRIAIQKQVTDANGKFEKDIEGYLEGYNDTGIFVDGVHIPYELVRHAEIIGFKKWSDIS